MTSRPAETEFITLPEASRRYGIGVKTLRRQARLGEFATYSVGTAWPRVRRAEFEAWVRSTQTVPGERARRHVDRMLARRRSMK